MILALMIVQAGLICARLVDGPLGDVSWAVIFLPVTALAATFPFSVVLYQYVLRAKTREDQSRGD